MEFSVKGNPNYCATIVQIEDKIDLPGCDNIQGTNIFGNHVIVSRDTKIGDVGVFFPVETSIKPVFLKANNLYRDTVLNTDQEKAGFFELNGRVRCMKLRGFKSEGFFIPLSSLGVLPFLNDLEITLIGTEFDHIDGEMICEKYVVKSKNTQGANKSNKNNTKIKRFNKLREGFFRLHVDTAQLGKNLGHFNLSDLVSITEKLHGTSFVVSNMSCNRKLSFMEKILIRVRKWAEN